MHGFSKDNKTPYKVDLFHADGSIFKNQKSVYISQTIDGIFEECSILAPTKTLGGSWGSAKGLILTLAASTSLKIPFFVGLPRSTFAPLDEGFYVTDFMEATVVDDQGKVWGKIEAAFEEKKGDIHSLNFLLRCGDGESFEFPFAWVDAKITKRNFNDGLKEVLVPDLSLWKDL